MIHKYALCSTMLLGLPLGLLGQGLQLTQTTPGRHAVAASPTAPVTLTFSQAVDAATSQQIQVHSARTGKRAGSYSTAGATVTFAPTRPFQPGEELRVSIPSQVQAASGAAVAPQGFAFTAAAGGTGQGNFTAPATGGTIAITGASEQILMADMDGDTDLDVMTIDPFTNRLYLYANINGTYGAPSFTSLINAPAKAGAQQVAVADVDSDGDLDLVTVTPVPPTGPEGPTGLINVRLNNGAGIFTAPAANAQVVTAKGGFYSVMGDIDNDGDLDLLVSSPLIYGEIVSIFFNNGVGGFAPPATNAQVAVSSWNQRLLLGDVDNDGDLDLVTGDATLGTNTTVKIRLNNGQGVFTAPAANAEVNVGTGTLSIALADIDQDGDLDLAAASAPLVRLRLNNGSGAFAAPAANADVSIGAGPSGLTFADVDGDQDLDMLVVNTGSVMNLRLNNGAGVFTAPASNAAVTVGLTPSSIAMGDVDADGDLDVVTLNKGFGQTTPATLSLRLNSAVALAAKKGQGAQTALWPNPAHDLVQVRLAVPVAAVELLDGLSRPVRTVAVPAGTLETVLPLTGLASGVYLVRTGLQVQRLLVE